ncbi:MAG: hypothetical protein IKW39_01910 [Alphaproteobacteria bacterium]|nr:hypothetical protein [Alphaproteobacteria bacterium]
MTKNYIALIDCDCFFVSAERALNPDLIGKPVAVLSNNDGCVISRSKEAKALGLKMGEPYFMAKHNHANIIYARANHELYQKISDKVMNKLKSYTDEVEVCSIDEAYMLLTGLKRLYKKNYIEIAKMIREEIWKELKIPVSIGISSTKTLAKLASDKAKKSGGIFVIGEAKRKKILAQTLISDISGIGNKLGIKMREECIFTALDFVSRPEHWIKIKFHKNGIDLKNELNGISLFGIKKEHKRPISIQQTSALKEFTKDIEILEKALIGHIRKASKKARLEGGKASSIEVMLRNKEFMVFCEKVKLNVVTNQEIEIIPFALKALKKIYKPQMIWRSVGITLTNLVYGDYIQDDLFIKPKVSNEKLGKVLDVLEDKFGKGIIKIGK